MSIVTHSAWVYVEFEINVSYLSFVYTQLRFLLNLPIRFGANSRAQTISRAVSIEVSMPEVRSILATDCGSTTTKAILIEKIGDTYRLSARGEAPTTVEAPFDDVTVGVLNAVREIEELSGDASVILD